MKTYLNNLNKILSKNISIIIDLKEKEQRVEVLYNVAFQALYEHIFLPENKWLINELVEFTGRSLFNMDELFLKAEYDRLSKSSYTETVEQRNKNTLRFVLLYKFIMDPCRFIKELSENEFNYNKEQKECFKIFLKNNQNYFANMESVKQINRKLKYNLSYGWYTKNGEINQKLSDFENDCFIPTTSYSLENEVGCCIDKAKLILLILREQKIKSWINIVKCCDNEGKNKYHAYNVFCKANKYYYFDTFRENVCFEIVSNEIDRSIYYEYREFPNVKIVQVEEIPDNIPFSKIVEECFQKVRTKE